MNKKRCLKIAQRMNTLLLNEIGQGIDPARMLGEELYARDVLLVCDALRGSDLSMLAPMYRKAAAAADTAPSEGAPTSGFSASRFLSSIFGPPSGFDADHGDAPPRDGGWLARRRNKQP